MQQPSKKAAPKTIASLKDHALNRDSLLQIKGGNGDDCPLPLPPTSDIIGDHDVIG